MFASFDGAVYKEKVLIPSMDIHFFFKIKSIFQDSILRLQRKKYKLKSTFDYRRYM